MLANAILIVEDDGILCADMEDMLRAEGYGITGVLPSGEAALELVKEQQPDLIIMDIKLAGELDGISTVEQIKTVADIPVIYLTAYTEDSLIRRATETAPYAFLVKPVQERELIATIEMALHRHSLESKLRQTEKALRQSEQTLKNIVSNMYDLVALTDLAGNFKFLGPSHAILGYNLDSLIGKNVMDYVHPHDFERVSGVFNKFLSDPYREENKKVEYRYRRVDGSYLWFETVGELLLDEGGNQKEILFNTREITARKEAEEVLAFQLEIEKVISQISSYFVNLAAEKTDEGINHALQLTGELFDVDRSYLFLLSPDGKKMNNTHEWCKEGVEPQLEFLQNLPLHTFPWWLERLERLEHIAVQRVDELPPEAAAEKKILQDQSILSVLVVPLVWENELHGFMGFDAVAEEKIWTDEQISLLKVVSELIASALLKRQAEEAQRESEARNRAILNSMPDLMFIFDCNGVIHDYHANDESMLAVKPSHFLGKSVQEIFPSDIATRCLQAFEQAYTTKELQIIDYALDLPNGSKHFEARIIPMDEQRLLAVVQDITPRKAAEQKLADHTLELEELYHQLEILLLETHHRVKNNLAVIISLLNMQQRLMGDGKAAATLKDLSNRIHAMALVHEKLYHSKNFSRINMQQYLQTLIAHLRLTLLPQRSIEYEVEAEGVELALDAAVPCALIIQELLTNAIKHAFPPDGPVTGTAPAVIKVSLNQNKNACELEVSDNGIGLPPGLEPANNRTIGLRLVHLIGEHQLGGRVELLQHSPRGGTKFKLYFALKQS